MKSYRTLALKELLSQKVTSILILIAVVLSTMMTTIVGQSIGVLSAMREQQAIAIGGNRWVRPFDQKQTGDIDAAILTDHMMLEATELGLGTVWVCYFQPDVIRKEFDLPDNLEPTPLYMGYPREAVVELLLPAFLPFNLLKGGLNASITFLLYKPIVTALRKSGYVAASENEARQKHTGLLILASFIIVTCVLIILSMNGII